MHTIRRYSNRKLYDTSEKHYVTLHDVADTVRRGDDVLVVDHASGQDITAQTLAQAIYVEEMRGHRVPAAQFIKLIREGRPQVTEPTPACSAE